MLFVPCCCVQYHKRKDDKKKTTMNSKKYRNHEIIPQNDDHDQFHDDEFEDDADHDDHHRGDTVIGGRYRDRVIRSGSSEDNVGRDVEDRQQRSVTPSQSFGVDILRDSNDDGGTPLTAAFQTDDEDYEHHTGVVVDDDDDDDDHETPPGHPSNPPPPSSSSMASSLLSKFKFTSGNTANNHSSRLSSFDDTNSVASSTYRSVGQYDDDDDDDDDDVIESASSKAGGATGTAGNLHHGGGSGGDMLLLGGERSPLTGSFDDDDDGLHQMGLGSYELRKSKSGGSTSQQNINGLYMNFSSESDVGDSSDDDDEAQLRRYNLDFSNNSAEGDNSPHHDSNHSPGSGPRTPNQQGQRKRIVSMIPLSTSSNSLNSYDQDSTLYQIRQIPNHIWYTFQYLRSQARQRRANLLLQQSQEERTTEQQLHLCALTYCDATDQGICVVAVGLCVWLLWIGFIASTKTQLLRVVLIGFMLLTIRFATRPVYVYIQKQRLKRRAEQQRRRYNEEQGRGGGGGGQVPSRDESYLPNLRPRLGSSNLFRQDVIMENLGASPSSIKPLWDPSSSPSGNMRSSTTNKDHVASSSSSPGNNRNLVMSNHDVPLVELPTMTSSSSTNIISSTNNISNLSPVPGSKDPVLHSF